MSFLARIARSRQKDKRRKGGVVVSSKTSGVRVEMKRSSWARAKGGKANPLNSTKFVQVYYGILPCWGDLIWTV